MAKKAIQIGLLLGTLAVGGPLLANVTITQPVGGQNISADKSLNSTNGAAFTALGNIVITETVPSDFAAGNNQTFVLTPATGWRFNPGVGTVAFTGSRNFTAASVSVTASNATITFSVNGTDKLDTLTIGGLQVQALNGANLAAAEYIRNFYDNPGTAVIAGIEQDYTTFGLLNQVVGTARSLAIQTQPGNTATAGALFSPQPQVKVVDQFGNVRNLDNTTVVTAARASGSGTLLGTLTRTAVYGVAAHTNLSMNTAATITIQFSATNLISVTSDPVVVGPAPADRLVFTTQPGSAAAGSPFGVQPVIRTQDRLGNFTSFGLANHQNVTLTLTSGNGTLLGTSTLDIGIFGGNGTISFTDLRIDAAATNFQITASGPGFVNSSSGVFTVSSAPFTKLLLLMPGEVAAPGTPAGKTGTPSAQVAGTPFDVIVNAVDDYWNVVRTVTDTVGITASDSNATLPANAALVSGTKTMSVTLKTAGSATLTASNIFNPSKTSNFSPSIAVNPGPFSKLQILAPGETPAPGTVLGKIGTPVAQTAGTIFEVIINAVDANWNRIASISDIVGLTSSDANAILSANITLVGGTATLTVAPRTAGSSTVTATDITDTSKTSNPTPAISVAAGSFVQLQLLVPGETAAPGSTSGKSGVPIQQMLGQAFPVTVNAVDAYWNKVVTVADLISLSPSDANAILPPDNNLTAGTRTFEVTFYTLGSKTITVSDLHNNSIPAVTSLAISVANPLYAAATGGSAVSADGFGGTATGLTGPIYTEVASGNVGTGTIILKAPSGFVFDTATPLPTVLITGSSTKTYNINGVTSGTAAAMTSVATTQLVFTVTKASSGGYTNKLTWQNVRVRPSAGTPLATGNLRMAGTAVLVSVSTNSNLGLLCQVPGAAKALALQTQPSSNGTAGVPFAQQPVLQIRDKFGNFRTSDNATIVSASRSAGSGVLQGSTNATATAGLVTFANLSHNLATNISILFSSTGLTNVTSSIIAISAAPASTLAFVTQPGNATAGSIFGIQPRLMTRDSFGNNSTIGLPSSLSVDVALSPGAGPLQGTTTADIGTSAGNGTVTFSDLRTDSAGVNQQLRATANGLVNGISSPFTVNAGAANRMAIMTQPSANAEAGVAFPQQPFIRVEDAFGNLRTADNSTVVTVARNLGTGVLLGTKTATASGGIATFTNLSYTNMEAINLNFASGSLPLVTSTSVNVGAGPARKLRLIIQPSSTATAGQAFAQQPQVRIEDQYGNLRSGDNSTVVSASRSAGTSVLQGTTNAIAHGGIAIFTELSYPKAETMTVFFTSGSATNVTSSNVVVTAGAFARLQILAPGETNAPGTLTGKTGTPSAQAPDTAFSVTVNAVDANWNKVSATDLVSIGSSDINAALSTNAPLVAGTKTFSVKLSETGTNTVSASDATDPSKSSDATRGISVLARYTSALGGNAIPASTAGGPFTSLIGPTYSEKAAAEVGKGTFILAAPAGFEFDTASPAPSVSIDRVTTSSKAVNINGVTSGASVAMTSVSSTQLVFTITSTSSSTTCKLTWQNVRVRPTVSSPLAAGKITKSGTAVVAGVTNGVSNFGTLIEVTASGISMGGDVGTDPIVTTSNTARTNEGNEDSAIPAASSPNLSSVQSKLDAITAVAGGFKLSISGIPVATYIIERAASLRTSGTTWDNIGNVTLDDQGQWDPLESTCRHASLSIL